MKKVLIPVIAGMTLVSAATAQQQATPKLDVRPEQWQQRIEVMCGPSSFLGVYPADVNDDKAKELGMAETYGALLNEIVKESPAEKAGLQKNDVIISWNGTRVESAAALRRMIIETPSGRDVRIGYVRAGARQEMNAKIGTRPSPVEGMMEGMKEFKFDVEQFKDQFKLNAEQFKLDAEQFKLNAEQFKTEMAPNIERFIFLSAGDMRTGMTLQSMTPQLSKYFGLGENGGALIGAVHEGSSAAEAGLQAGDVVIAIDGEKVGSPIDAHKIIGQKGEGSVEVRVLRDKQERTFTVKLTGKPMDLNLNFRELEELYQNRGPIELFESLPDVEIEQEMVAPEEGDGDLSEMRNGQQRKMVVKMRPHAKVIPAPKHETRSDLPPAGL